MIPLSSRFNRSSSFFKSRMTPSNLDIEFPLARIVSTTKYVRQIQSLLRGKKLSKLSDITTVVLFAEK